MRAARLLAVNLLLLAGLLVAGLAGLEAWWERAADAGWKQLDARSRSAYTWSYATPDGTPIGTHRGVLRLMTHPTVVYVNLPDQQTGRFHIDARGFRSLGPQAPGGRRRILLVGGSTAFGTGLEADAQTFAAGLARELGDVEVVNAAVIGHRSGQELSYLANELIDLEPDLVISLSGANDFGQVGRPRTRWFDLNGAEQTHARLRLLNRLAYADLPTRLASSWRVLFPQLTHRLGLDAPEAGEPPGRPLGVDEVADSYARNQWKMARIGSAFGARFLCVLQPHRGSLAAELPPPPWDRYPAFRSGVARRLGARDVPVLDLNDRALPWRMAMFMDALHLDAAGNALMARRVALFIREEGLLPAPDVSQEGDPRRAPGASGIAAAPGPAPGPPAPR